MFRFIYAIIAVGGHFTLEHPELSILWSDPRIFELVEAGVMQVVRTDMCAHGLRSPPGIEPVEYYKKPSKVAGSLPGLEAIRCLCPGGHVHTSLGRRKQIPLADGRRTSRIAWAGTYTSLFSSRLARIASRCRDAEM